MKWTIGIVTSGDEWDRINQICKTIRENSDNHDYDDVQIIVVGGDYAPVYLEEVHGFMHVPFNESIKNGWITKKKNLIAAVALNENLCIMHDYVSLNPGWFDGFEDFGSDWKTCMTPIENKDGSRFRDWCVIYNDAWMDPPIDDEQPPALAPPGRLIQYCTLTGYERWQYFSGAYFCVKRDVLLEVPFDETRVWGQGEDVQWSRLLYQRYSDGVFSLNTRSSVRFLKEKTCAPWETLPPVM